MNAARVRKPIWLALAAIFVCLSLACSLIGVPASQGELPSPTTASAEILPVTPTQAITATANQPLATPSDLLSLPADALDALFLLRSISFQLTTTLPDGSMRSMTGDVDPAGNMHIKFILPVYDPSGMPAGFQASTDSPETELFVLGGKGFELDPDNPDWKTIPVYEDTSSILSYELHGMDSLSTWLTLLPVGSLTPAGSEETGGFQTARLIVDGTINDERVHGTLWKDTASHALVGAELHIPSALLNEPGSAPEGEMLIVLQAQQAEVPPVTLPD